MDILRFARENTVSSVNQMQHRCFYGDPEAVHPRVLFVGNSITLHGILPEIGWNRLCGMAASEERADYVHLLMSMLAKDHPDISYAIAQAAEWEREYWNPEHALSEIALAHEWDADIIIFRLSENTPPDALAKHDYLQATVDFAHWLDPMNKAGFVFTDGFWPNPQKDLVMYQAAKALNGCFVSLSDLGCRDDMKAIGLFEHSGVANHPGDKGMAAIAERLYSVVKDLADRID